MLPTHQPGLGVAGLIAVVAAFAVSAVVATAASATLPELLWCMGNSTGKYETETKCENLDETGAGSLTWEWEGDPLTGETVEFMVKGGKAELKSASASIECTSYSGGFEIELMTNGEQLFKTTTSGALTFLGCKEVGGVKASCKSESPLGASGEIITKATTASLVYLKSSKGLPVGLLLEPTSGTIFTTLECLGGLVKENVEGSVIGEVLSPVNTEATTGKVLYEESAGKTQLWNKVEQGAATHELTAFGGPAVEITESTGELLINGTALTFTIDA